MSPFSAYTDTDNAANDISTHHPTFSTSSCYFHTTQCTRHCLLEFYLQTKIIFLLAVAHGFPRCKLPGANRRRCTTHEPI